MGLGVSGREPKPHRSLPYNSPMRGDNADIRSLGDATRSSPDPADPVIVGPGLTPDRPSDQRDLQRQSPEHTPAPARRLCVSDDPDTDPQFDDDEQRQAARRILFAMLLAIIATPGLLLLLAWAKIEMSPMLVVLIVGTVVGGAILGASPGQTPRPRRPLDDGRPIGCCGPRPLRGFRDKRG